MMTAKVFENGRSQAVRLPKECRFKKAIMGRSGNRYCCICVVPFCMENAMEIHSLDYETVASSSKAGKPHIIHVSFNKEKQEFSFICLVFSDFRFIKPPSWGAKK